MNYPLCEKYGLKVFNTSFYLQSGAHMGCKAIKASEVEQLLASGVEVFGSRDCTGVSPDKFNGDTHSGIILSYKPIEKEQPVSKEELLMELKEVFSVSKHTMSSEMKNDVKNLINRIEKAGVK